jgi:hypothetical protein
MYLVSLETTQELKVVKSFPQLTFEQLNKIQASKLETSHLDEVQLQMEQSKWNAYLHS